MIYARESDKAVENPNNKNSNSNSNNNNHNYKTTLASENALLDYFPIKGNTKK